MTQYSAGILLFQFGSDGLAVLLVHPGGPYWRRKDKGAWQIPKGLAEPGEEIAAAARREVQEELGLRLTGELQPLCEIRQAGGKRVSAFALRHAIDTRSINSNRFELEWPPGSGTIQSFPEVDAARWMGIEEAKEFILPSQLPLLERLEDLVAR
jgi:Predicted NTP pyrophosphohydrolase